MANFVRHDSCPECGSKDNLAIYDDGSYFCFSYCGYKKISDEMLAEFKHNKPSRVRSKASVISEEEKQERKTMSKELITAEENEELKSKTKLSGANYRGISDEVLKFYGCRTEFDDDGDVYARYYPYTIEGELSGYKVRKHPKIFGGNIGNTGKDCQMYGQFRFANGGKYLLIVEGEEDCHAAYQMFLEYSRSKDSEFVTAVVSVGQGVASHKQVAANYEFFNKFDNIVLGLDADEAGSEGIEKIVAALPKGKVKIATWNKKLKDPNNYLEESQQKLFIRDFYAAEAYVPVGVVGSSHLYDRMLQKSGQPKVPFPPLLEELNKMFVGGLSLGYIINIASDTGVGKCLGKDTPVRMYDLSVKKVQDIVNGDLVMGPDGTPRVVSGVTSGVDKMYKVTQTNGMSYVVNSAHILSLKAGSNIDKLNVKKGEVVNINVEDYLKLKVRNGHTLKGYIADMNNFGDGELDADDCYMLGLWLAEGTSAKAQLTICDSDIELGDFVRNYCKARSYGLTVINQGTNCSYYNITGGFLNWLRNQGVLGNKHIPMEYLFADKTSRLNLLAGFIDGDGYLTNKGWQLTLKDDQLANDVKTLTQTLGLVISDNLVFKKCQNFEGDFYRNFHISGSTDLVPNRLVRKAAEKSSSKIDKTVTGILVEYIGIDNYYGFKVDKDHLFCLEDFTVTHNTTIVNELIYYWIFHSPHKVGILSMELDDAQYAEVMLSRHIEKKLALMPDDQKKDFIRTDGFKKASDELFKNEDGSDRFFLVDDRDGSVEDLQNAIEQLIIGANCKVIVIDVLQDVLDGLSNEEQAVFMKWAKSMIKSHGVLFIFINHKRKSAAGESGGVGMNESDIHGSSTIIKSAGVNILMGRDKMSSDDIIRNTTVLGVSKNRMCGLTGPAGALYYVNEEHKLYNFNEYFGKTLEEYLEEKKH